MKVAAEVKITILEGKLKGKTDNYITIGDTNTKYTKYGIIERLRLEWSYIHNLQEGDSNNDKHRA